MRAVARKLPPVQHAWASRMHRRPCNHSIPQARTASNLVSESRSPQWPMPRPGHRPPAVLAPHRCPCRLPLSCLQLRPTLAGMMAPGWPAVGPPEKLAGKVLRQLPCQLPPCRACSWAAAAEGPAGLCPGHGKLGELGGHVEVPPNPLPLPVLGPVGQYCWADLDQEPWSWGLPPLIIDQHPQMPACWRLDEIPLILLLRVGLLVCLSGQQMSPGCWAKGHPGALPSSAQLQAPWIWPAQHPLQGSRDPSQGLMGLSLLVLAQSWGPGGGSGGAAGGWGSWRLQGLSSGVWKSGPRHRLWPARSWHPRRYCAAGRPAPR